MKLQRNHWISIVLFIVAIVLMGINIAKTASGTKSTFIEIMAWIMLIVANLYMLWIRYQSLKNKEKSSE